MRRRSQPEYTPPSEPSGEFLQQPISRRKFLSTAGRMAAVGMAGDMIQGEILWGGTNPEIHTLDNPEAQKQFPSTYTLAIGGFNVANVKGLAETVQEIFPGYGQVAYLQNAENGIHMGDIEREALRFIKENEVTRLRLYGHSMGGMMAIQLASQLKEKVSSLEAIILDCTPASHEDIRGNKQTAAWLLQITDDAELHMGPITRMAMETASPLLDGRDDIMTLCLNAIRKVSSPDDICSNRLVQAQASFMRAFNISDFYHTFSSSTHILRLRPRDYSADPTIDNETSLPRFRDGLGHIVMDVPVLGSGHANPGGHEQSYRTSLLSAAKTCGFYDAAPSRRTSRPI